MSYARFLTATTIVVLACFLVKFLRDSPPREDPVKFGNMAAVLKFLTVPSLKKHTATVIFVHVRMDGRLVLNAIITE